LVRSSEENHHMSNHAKSTDAGRLSAPNSGREPTRRKALAMMGTSAGVACVGLTNYALRSASQDDRPAADADDQALDEVLRQLQAAEPKSLQGLSTHAPMAAEALCALGFPQKAGPWLKNYRRPVRELPGTKMRIDPNKWKDALGPDAQAETW